MTTSTDTQTRDDVAARAGLLAEQLGKLDEQLLDVEEQLSAATSSGKLPDRQLLGERRDLLDTREHVDAAHQTAVAEVARLDAEKAAAAAEARRVAGEARAARERAAAAATAHVLADGWPAFLAAAEQTIRDTADAVRRHRADFDAAVATARGEGGARMLPDRIHHLHMDVGDLPRIRVWTAAATSSTADTAGALVAAAFGGPPSAPQAPAQGLATIPLHEQEAAWRASNGQPRPIDEYHQKQAEEARQADLKRRQDAVHAATMSDTAPSAS